MPLQSDSKMHSWNHVEAHAQKILNISVNQGNAPINFIQQQVFPIAIS